MFTYAPNPTFTAKFSTQMSLCFFLAKASKERPSVTRSMHKWAFLVINWRDKLAVIPGESRYYEIGIFRILCGWWIMGCRLKLQVRGSLKIHHHIRFWESYVTLSVSSHSSDHERTLLISLPLKASLKPLSLRSLPNSQHKCSHVLIFIWPRLRKRGLLQHNQCTMSNFGYKLEW